LVPYVEKLLAVKLRDGAELAKYENVENATPRGGLRNVECFSDGGRGIRERVVPKELRNMASDRVVLPRDLLNPI
jgi:hypothetical protein